MRTSVPALPRWRALRHPCLLLALCLCGTAVHAQTGAAAAPQSNAFPNRSLRLVVPGLPGGGTDILSRLLAPKLTEYLSQSMIIENRAGASTNIGTEFTARAAPDGYTVLVATTPHAVNPSLFRKLPFDPIKDFTMISQLALTQNVVLVHPSLPVKTIKEFIALAKARPGQAINATAANAMTHTTPIARACTRIHEASPRSRAGEMLAFRGGVLSPWAEATKVVEKHGARPGVPHLREHHHDAMAPL